MAKKGARQIFALVCTVCKSQNYLTEKNKVNTPDSLNTAGKRFGDFLIGDLCHVKSFLSFDRTHLDAFDEVFLEYYK